MSPAATVLLAAVLGCAWSLPLHAAPSTDVEAARAELGAGLAAYERGEFEAAVAHFERAHGLDPTPASLYAWAQAARSAGDCATAVELYRRFIDGGASGDSRIAAEQNEARCREQLAEESPPPVAVPTPVPEPEPEPELAPAPVAPRRDPTAIALLTTGAIATATGIVLLGIAGAEQHEQSRTHDYARFDELDLRIDRLYIAGGITLGVGAVLLAVGATKMAITRRRARAISVAPTWTAGGGAMLMLRVGR